MRLFNLSTLVSFLAVGPLTAVCAYPTHEGPALITAGEYNQANKRARPARPGIEIDVVNVALNTWQGYRVHPGLFGATMDSEQIKASTRKTYADLAGRTSLRTLLVSVIYVPGKGLAAGTIWNSVPQTFETHAAQTAPNFWAAVPGPGQGLMPNARNDDMWHAEAVAVQKAEEEFGDQMIGGQWPQGTKIYTYGKIQGGERDPKASCSIVVPSSNLASPE
jgi:hypothetical protein